MKRKLTARICAICGSTKGGKYASFLHLKWLREKRPDLVPFDDDFVHPACLRAAHAVARAAEIAQGAK